MDHSKARNAITKVFSPAQEGKNIFDVRRFKKFEPAKLHKRNIATDKLNYAASPPSENSRHLTDFQGTLERARDFGLERPEICAVYAGELTIEEAR